MAKIFRGLLRGTAAPPPVGAPGTPSNLTATAAGDGDTTVTWERADADDTSIVIERAPDVAGVAGTYVAQTLEAHANCFADWSCEPATKYHYRVKAVNASGSSAYSTSSSCTTAAFGGNVIDDIASLTAIADSPWQITLSWSSPGNGGGGAGYYLQRSTDGVFYNTIALILSVAAAAVAETYIDGGVGAEPFGTTPLLPNTTYYYRLQKVDFTYPYGHWCYSNSATTSSLGFSPDAPRSPTHVVNSATSTTLSWTDTNSGTATYIVETATVPGSGYTSGATFTQATETAAGATSYGLTTVAKTPLFVRIKAKKNGNSSAWTKTFCVRPASTGTGGSTYDIGPGKTYTTIGGLNWANVGPGDLIRIYYDTYAEKFAVTCRGTAANPIRILGISDGSGNRPVITGLNATTNSQFSIQPIFEPLGLIHFGKLAADNAAHQAGYITFENIDVTNTNGDRIPIASIGTGNPATVTTTSPHGLSTGNTVTITGTIRDDLGYPSVANGRWAITVTGASTFTIPVNVTSGQAAAGGDAQKHHAFTLVSGSASAFDDGNGIYIARGDHLTFKNNKFHSVADGIFGAGGGDATRELFDVTVQNNYFYNNGIVGSYLCHNTYLEGQRMTYEFNRYSSERPGALGGSIKDRSSGIIIRYNYIEGGALHLDLCESQNSNTISEVDRSYHFPYVYGNVFSIVDADISLGPIHYGADHGVPWPQRRGILYFAHNTFVFRFNAASFDRQFVFSLKESIVAGIMDARNNVIVSKNDTGSPSSLYLVNVNGCVMFGGKNWVTPYATVAYYVGVGNGRAAGLSNLLSAVGNAPNFTSITTGDYRPSGTSPFINQATQALAGSMPTAVNQQYVMHQQSAVRSTTNDLGYFEN